jgi:hypothetical protein
MTTTRNWPQTNQAEAVKRPRLAVGVALTRGLKATIAASIAVSASQSWIDPGAAAGGEGDVAGVVVGPSVAGAARAWAGVLDAALGGGSELMDSVSAGLASSLCGGFSRVNGGIGFFVAAAGQG